MPNTRHNLPPGCSIEEISDKETEQREDSGGYEITDADHEAMRRRAKEFIEQNMTTPTLEQLETRERELWANVEYFQATKDRADSMYLLAIQQHNQHWSDAYRALNKAKLKAEILAEQETKG